MDEGGLCIVAKSIDEMQLSRLISRLCFARSVPGQTTVGQVAMQPPTLSGLTPPSHVIRFRKNGSVKTRGSWVACGYIALRWVSDEAKVTFDANDLDERRSR